MRPSPKNIPSRRLAFTLVELLIVIAIIALLIGLLVPALMNVRRNAQIAEISVDIREIDAALTAFKNKYGDYPPSRISLYNSAAGWNGDRRSKTIIRKFWPQFDFTSDGANGGSPARRDLDGSECLLFFLAGVRDGDGKYIGFSNNPARPFLATGQSRVDPFLSDIESTRIDTSDPDGDGFYVYKDPVSTSTEPYVYYSSYGGQGYDSADHTAYGSGKPVFYREGTAANAKRLKPQSYQIISAGLDGRFGPGGAYTPDKSTVLPGANRDDEADNVTNFSGGTLE